MTSRAIVTRSGPALNADGAVAYTGRRTRLTTQVTAEIATAIKDGAPVLDAICAIARVRPDTAKHWLQVGRGEHPLYPNPHARYVDLVREVEEAESDLVLRLAQGLARPEEHWKGRLTMLGALRNQYRDQPAPTVAATPLQAITDHLREVRRLIETRDAPVKLKVIDVPVKELPNVNRGTASQGEGAQAPPA